MQRYYRTVMTVRRLNDMLLQYLDEEILHSGRGARITRLNDRFQIRNNHLETTAPDVFEREPSALLEVFVLLGEDPEILDLRSTTIRQILGNQWRIDAEFRNDPRNHALFVRLLECKGNLSNQLQRMTRYGILGSYLPEFGRIVGQMQHDLFHVYPVDAHIIQVIRNMRRLANQSEADRFPIASHVGKNLPKPKPCIKKQLSAASKALEMKAQLWFILCSLMAIFSAAKRRAPKQTYKRNASFI